MKAIVVDAIKRVAELAPGFKGSATEWERKLAEMGEVYNHQSVWNALQSAERHGIVKSEKYAHIRIYSAANGVKG